MPARFDPAMLVPVKSLRGGWRYSCCGAVQIPVRDTYLEERLSYCGDVFVFRYTRLRKIKVLVKGAFLEQSYDCLQTISLLGKDICAQKR
ncbi:hypothetical protein DPMN_193191 [Dreissena polymorpha]|uniref:Uncharacterized protein n=1 Tax=Dreissena polymorpha TaxID=45954 RepID=A0A9D4BDZ5_DREPO|nr:hypothetical protein DPMN_193191 [Dreissena polymorpha]